MASYSIESFRRPLIRGFTLLELAVAVAVLGIIVGLGLPAYPRIQRNARFGALSNDLRVLAGAFQQYAAANATWPAYSASPNAIPAGMEEYLRATNWRQPTVFGGRYHWDRGVTHNGRQVPAAIAIYSAADSPLTMTTAEMQEYDRRFDDGSLATGNFQQGYGGCALYVIEDDAASAAPAANPTSTPAPATVPAIENLDPANASPTAPRTPPAPSDPVQPDVPANRPGHPTHPTHPATPKQQPGSLGSKGSGPEAKNN